MGKRLSISQPTVIQTELTPLSESFTLEANGQTEQWYYENTSLFSPDREIAPLIITPNLTVLDPDTNNTYNPSFQASWKVQSWNGTAWVDELVQTQQDLISNPYVKSGNNLIVHKNNPDATHAIKITCTATYSDPRDRGITYQTEEQITLTTNKDASVIYPNLNEMGESSRMYNPLRTTDPEFDFVADADWSQVTEINKDIIEYKADPLGTEAIVPNNENGIQTCAPFMDIRYGSTQLNNQQFMFRQVSGGQVASIPNGAASILALRGNTIKWNNLASTLQESYIQKYNCTSNFTNDEAQFTIGNTNTIFVVTSFHGRYFPNHVYYLCMDAHNNGSGTAYISIAKTTSQGMAIMLASDLNISTSYSKIKSIVKTDIADGDTGLYIRCNDSNYNAVFTINRNTFKIVDLTAIWGEGNEPTTFEIVEQYLAQLGNAPLPYSEGTITPVKMAGVKSVGFNLWDEEISTKVIDSTTGEQTGRDNVCISSLNHIPVIGDTTYYVKCLYGSGSGNGIYIKQFDASFNPLSNNWDFQNVTDYTFTTSKNACYIKFMTLGAYGSTYNHDICINLSDPAKNGTYEPYKGGVANFDVTKLRGKLNDAGSLVYPFSNGMNGFNNIFDEVKIDNGQFIGVKKYGRKNLGDLGWSYDVSNNWFYVLGQSYIKSSTINLLNAKYNASEDMVAVHGDKLISINTTSAIKIADSSYSDAATFKAAMQDVELIYELATPEEYVLEPVKRGTFEWFTMVNNNEVKIDTIPAYKEATQKLGNGQGTDTITLNALYGENIPIILKIKRFAGDTTYLPPKVYRSIVWRNPHLDSIIQCDNGSAVRAESNEFKFKSIVNIQGENLGEDVIQANLRFKWTYRKCNMSLTTSSVLQLGWGREVFLHRDDLLHITEGGTIASTSVDNEVYLLGAYEELTYNNEVVTDNGEVVYSRT